MIDAPRSAYEMWEPEPPRCIECGSIIDLRRGPEWDDGDPDGYCSTCDRLVVAVYPDSQDPENSQEEEHDE